MSSNKIKKDLRESIENIEDSAFLIAIKQIIERKYKPSSVPKISNWQMKRMDESRIQLAQGKCFSNYKADLLIDKWLNE